VSTKSIAQGNRFIRNLRTAGFAGAIYPLHPEASDIEGLKAYRSFQELPEPVDYAFIAVSAERVSEVLREASGRLRFAQVMSSGFSETPGGGEREASLVDAARSGGIRLLGPNCMGTHSPRGKMTFMDGGPDVPGAVGVMSQSGGLLIDILHRGRHRGIQFSSAVSLGNCADLGPNELLEFFLADPDTRVIGAYLEHNKDGRHFFELLRAASGRKPIVILKGGRTQQGQRAAASHTGSLADNDQVWRALSAQTGCILVETLEEFMDALVVFQTYRQRKVPPTGEVVLLGNGGGASVLATDLLARAGLHISPLNASTATALGRVSLPAGASLLNPIDIPANVLKTDKGALARQILEILSTHAAVDAILIHLNVGVILGYKDIDLLGDLVSALVAVKRKFEGGIPMMVTLRSNGEREVEQRKNECRLSAMKADIPVFDELSNQARAGALLAAYEQFRYRRESAGGSRVSALK